MSPRRDLTRADRAAGRRATAAMIGIHYPDTAAAIHHAVANQLSRLGFRVAYEYPTRHLGDTRNGRIDLAAWYEGGRVAIELDARRPRRRSVNKLILFEGFRIIGLRGVAGEAPDGIDALVSIPVRIPSQEEKNDKRTRNRVRAA